MSSRATNPINPDAIYPFDARGVAIAYMQREPGAIVIDFSCREGVS